MTLSSTRVQVEDESTIGAFASYTAGASGGDASAAAAARASASASAPAGGAAGYTGTRLWPSVRMLLTEHGLVPSSVGNLQ